MIFYCIKLFQAAIDIHFSEIVKFFQIHPYFGMAAK